MNRLMTVAQQYGLAVIEDATESLGSTITAGQYSGRHSGTIGDFGCFSFQGAKLVSAGEGGLLVTNDKELNERALQFGDHGRKPDKTFRIDHLGYKYKMSNVQAAVALAQLERIDDLLAKKQKIRDWYEELLTDTPLTFQKAKTNTKRSHWMVSVLLPEGTDRNLFRAAPDAGRHRLPSDLPGHQPLPDMGSLRQRA